MGSRAGGPRRSLLAFPRRARRARSPPVARPFRVLRGDGLGLADMYFALFSRFSRSHLVRGFTTLSENASPRVGRKDKLRFFPLASDAEGRCGPFMFLAVITRPDQSSYRPSGMEAINSTSARRVLRNEAHGQGGRDAGPAESLTSRERGPEARKFRWTAEAVDYLATGHRIDDSARGRATAAFLGTADGLVFDRNDVIDLTKVKSAWRRRR